MPAHVPPASPDGAAVALWEAAWPIRAAASLDASSANPVAVVLAQLAHREHRDRASAAVPAGSDRDTAAVPEQAQDGRAHQGAAQVQPEMAAFGSAASNAAPNRDAVARRAALPADSQLPDEAPPDAERWAHLGSIRDAVAQVAAEWVLPEPLSW